MTRFECSYSFTVRLKNVLIHVCRRTIVTLRDRSKFGKLLVFREVENCNFLSVIHQKLLEQVDIAGSAKSLFPRLNLGMDHRSGALFVGMTV